MQFRSLFKKLPSNAFLIVCQTKVAKTEKEMPREAEQNMLRICSLVHFMVGMQSQPLNKFFEFYFLFVYFNENSFINEMLFLCK